jgi:hypothetical protein
MWNRIKKAMASESKLPTSEEKLDRVTKYWEELCGRTS